MSTTDDVGEDDPGKLFVGGLSWQTTEEHLRKYFSEFGEVVDTLVMKNIESGQSRGFGFVTFSDHQAVLDVLKKGPHLVDGRAIDPKPCNAKAAARMKRNSQYPKVFLGGLPYNVTESDIRNTLSQFGKVMEINIMWDHEHNKCRGFGFLSFEDDEGVDKCVAEHYITINGKKVEVKRAQPRDGKDAQTGSNNQNGVSNGAQAAGPPGQNYPGWGPGYGYGPPPGGPVSYAGPWSGPPSQWGPPYPFYGPYGGPPYPWNWNVPPHSYGPPFPPQGPGAPGGPGMPGPGGPPVRGPALPPMAGGPGGPPGGPPGPVPGSGQGQSASGGATSAATAQDAYHTGAGATSGSAATGSSTVKSEYGSSYSGGGYAGYSLDYGQGGSASRGMYGMNSEGYSSSPGYGGGPGPQRNSQSQLGFHPYRRV